MQLEIVLISTQERCTVCAECAMGMEIALGTPDGVTYVEWKLVSIRLGKVLVLVQDMCMVCAECTICLEIILDAPDGTPR
jgi:NAD-dependent dihydropyrimidine dehydrogenase PreA subunit